MERVGVRELKENLSRYLRRVRSGEKIVVTDRKQQIAAIVPLVSDEDDEKLLGLVSRGRAQWSGGKPAGLKSRVVSKGKRVSDAVVEDRR